MSEKIIVKINAIGGANIDVDGVVGERCKEITAPLEEIFRGNSVTSKDKAELIMLDEPLSEELTN